MKLSELLAEMQKALNDYGDLDMVVIRNGDIYPIIETCIDTDNNYYYIEAYKEYE